jgi:hypothetical protein
MPLQGAVAPYSRGVGALAGSGFAQEREQLGEEFLTAGEMEAGPEARPASTSATGGQGTNVTLPSR